MILDNLYLFGIEEIVKNPELGGKDVLLRIPEETRVQLDKYTQDTAFLACGCEIRFELIDPQVKVSIPMYSGSEGEVGIAVLMRGPYVERFIYLSKGENLITITKNEYERPEGIAKSEGYAFSTDVVRVVLPAGEKIGVPDVIGRVKVPDKEKMPAKLGISYGSSITNGGCSFVPTQTYPFQLAQMLNADVRNLGFPGTCRAEKAIADYLASCDFDFMTLELGANLIWDNEKNDWGSIDFFRDRIGYLIDTIVEKNPTKPIVCTDLFLCGMDYSKDQILFDFRDVVKEKAMTAKGNIKYINGLEFARNYYGLNVDILHPSITGMREIAERFQKELWQVLNS